MPLIDIYGSCKTEISKWRASLERQREGFLNDKKLDKNFNETYKLIFESLARIETILADINRCPSLANGKRLIWWLEKIKIDVDEQVQVLSDAVKNKASNDLRSICDNHLAFTTFLTLLIKYCKPKVEETEQSIDAVDYLKWLNIECRDFIDDSLSKLNQGNKRIVWRDDGFFNHRKKHKKQTTTISMSPADAERVNKENISTQAEELNEEKVGIEATATPATLSCRYSLQPLKRSYSSEITLFLMRSNSSDDNTPPNKADNLKHRLTQAREYIAGIYGKVEIQAYIELLEQLAEGQKIDFHNKIDTLMRLVLIAIRGVKDFETFYLKVEGYNASFICSQEPPEDQLSQPLASTLSLTPPN